MSAFSEAALERKLSELSNSQQSVQTLSLWLIHHRKHSALIVSVWERELRKGEPRAGQGPPDAPRGGGSGEEADVAAPLRSAAARGREGGGGGAARPAEPGKQAGREGG